MVFAWVFQWWAGSSTSCISQGTQDIERGIFLEAPKLAPLEKWPGI